MGVWAGWEAEFLTAAQVPDTAQNRRFLDDWHSHAETNCGNNPVDLSALVSGSTDCASLPAINAKAQHYTTHGNAAHAFYVQTHANYAKALLAALKSGNPYTVGNTGTVAQDLSAWGSQAFSQTYFNETANAPGRGGAVPGVHDARLLHGWRSLQGSLGPNMRHALASSAKSRRAALQSLARARRVRL